MPAYTVGPTGNFPTIAAAMASATLLPGDTLNLQPGYSGESATITVDNLTINGDASNTGFILTLAVDDISLTGAAPIAVTGNGSDNTISGNAGANILTGGAGLDSISGGDGDDQFRVAPGDVVVGETYNGGSGVDRLVLSGTINFTGTTLTSIDRLEFAALAASGATFTFDLVGGASLANALAVQGDAHANTITVNTVLADTEVSLLGWTFTNWDPLVDTIVINGSSGADSIAGSIQRDIIQAGDGIDEIRGGGGNDVLQGQGGNDTLIYLAGDGADTIDGGADTDTLSIQGTSGADSVTVEIDGTGTIIGVGGGTLTGVEFVSIDLFSPNGHDTVVYTSSVLGVTVNLAAGTATGFNSIANVENVTGTAFADTFTGNNNFQNFFNGGGGNDVFNDLGSVTSNDSDEANGGAGDDTFNYVTRARDRGYVRIDGGADVDTLAIAGTAATDDHVRIVLQGGLITNIGVSTQNPGIVQNVELATLSNDGSIESLSYVIRQIFDDNTEGEIFAATTQDVVATVNGAATGFDTLAGSGIRHIQGGTGNDTLTGDAGANVLKGGTGNDRLTGGSGVDELVGFFGSDHLVVGSASVEAGEIYSGGDGTDRLHVGAGNYDFTIATVSSIEQLEFDGGGAASATFGFTSGFGALASTLAIDGSADADAITINVAWPFEIFFSFWTFTDWTDGVDTITFNGSAGSEVITGTVRRDTMLGGGGDDWLAGHTGDDTLTGGAGNDTFRFSAGHGHDVITDFTAGAGSDDRLSLAIPGFASLGALLLNATQVGADTVIDTGPGSSITLQNVAKASLTADDFIGLPAIQTDLNGDTRGDILWRNTVDNTLSRWLLDGSGHFTAGALGPKPTADWKIAETGDFNGDLVTDILWRHDSGSVVVWHMNANGTNQPSQSFAPRDASWKVAESADFNGDSRSDVLWRHASGQVELWLSINGGFSVQTLASPDNSWKIQTAGDFNGDRLADIAWRNDDGTVVLWLMNDANSFVGQVLGAPASDWQIEGAGDFNADGRSDILWRNTDGTVVTWLLNDGGSFTGQVLAAPDNSWQIQDTIDANADGYSDILWRNTDGTVSVWLFNASLSFGAFTLAGPEASWQIQNDPTGIV